jgi:hypothetical protein
MTFTALAAAGILAVITLSLGAALVAINGWPGGEDNGPGTPLELPRAPRPRTHHGAFLILRLPVARPSPPRAAPTTRPRPRAIPVRATAPEPAPAAPIRSQRAPRPSPATPPAQSTPGSPPAPHPAPQPPTPAAPETTPRAPAPPTPAPPIEAPAVTTPIAPATPAVADTGKTLTDATTGAAQTVTGLTDDTVIRDVTGAVGGILQRAACAANPPDLPPVAPGSPPPSRPSRAR